jgi:nucleotide-binding universal stress UspA family protein
MPAVVAGVDGSVHSVAAAHWAAAEAARRGTGLLLVAGRYHLGHAPDSGESYAETEARARAMLASVAAEARVGVTSLVRGGYPAALLVEEAQNAAPVVLGRRGPGRAVGLGSTTHAVLHHAPSPVAVVPHSRLGEQQTCCDMYRRPRSVIEFVDPFKARLNDGRGKGSRLSCLLVELRFHGDTNSERYIQGVG